MLLDKYPKDHGGLSAQFRSEPGNSRARQPQFGCIGGSSWIWRLRQPMFQRRCDPHRPATARAEDALKRRVT